MKALSIMQPWAWAIVNGYKDIENRSWPTRFRGRIYVHAGQKIDRAAWPFLREVLPHVVIPSPEEVLRGGIVGEVEIIDCVTRHSSPWFFGSYGFVLRGGSPLTFQQCAGKLGFFEPNTGGSEFGQSRRPKPPAQGGLF